jgi:hypothetical protein
MEPPQPQVPLANRLLNRSQTGGPNVEQITDWHRPGASAFGTDHPVDIALGRARRLKNYAELAKGNAAVSPLEEAAESMRVPQQPIPGGM